MSKKSAIDHPNYGMARFNLSTHTKSVFKSSVARYWRAVNEGPGRLECYTLDPDEDTVCHLSVGDEAVWWNGPVVLHSVDEKGAMVLVEFASDMSHWSS
jgi:hypothetical protein